MIDELVMWGWCVWGVLEVVYVLVYFLFEVCEEVCVE